MVEASPKKIDTTRYLERGLEFLASRLDSLALVGIAGIFKWLDTHELPYLPRPKILMRHLSVK
jgi:hypothetical protein